MSVIIDIKQIFHVLYSRSFYVNNSDTFLQNPIGVKLKSPVCVFRDYDLLSRNSTYLSRKCHLLSHNYDSGISQLRRTN